ncbi:hypothetical protein [Synergistes jonesii]|uniref:hypothetical protein n=1 Tax=Synergistes jonesii TaxID=2754 RepID=UPI00242E9D75|nr:hypothetical protein [Synergistes jonesii]
MTRDFEKQYPLPFREHVFQDNKNLTVYAGNGHYIFSSRIENRFDVFKYMVACANLMPEAVDLIKSFAVLCKDYKLTASIKCNGEEVDAPLINIFQRGCEDFLAKLGDVAE